MPTCHICGYSNRKRIMKGYFTKIGRKYYCSRCYDENLERISAAYRKEEFNRAYRKQKRKKGRK